MTSLHDRLSLFWWRSVAIGLDAAILFAGSAIPLMAWWVDAWRNVRGSWYRLAIAALLVLYVSSEMVSGTTLGKRLLRLDTVPLQAPILSLRRRSARVVCACGLQVLVAYAPAWGMGDHHLV